MKNKGIYKSVDGKNQVIDYYKKLLHLLPERSNFKTINTRYGETFTISRGDPSHPPLVLLHGSSSNSAMWINEVVELSKVYHVIAIDIPGECGLSSSKRSAFKKGVYADWLNQVLDSFELDRFYLVAYSLGGWIALDYALKYGQKVDKVILFASAGLVPVKTGTLFWLVVCSFLGKPGFDQLNKMVYRDLKMDAHSYKFAWLIKEYFIPRTDVAPVYDNNDLSSIACPVVYFGGEMDCFYNTKRSAKRIQDNMEDSNCTVIPKQGHVIPALYDKIISSIS